MLAKIQKVNLYYVLNCNCNSKKHVDYQYQNPILLLPSQFSQRQMSSGSSLAQFEVALATVCIVHLTAHPLYAMFLHSLEMEVYAIRHM